ncbi:hypothetical protein ABPG74_016941 [Tetrahymena malaccensis]
MQNTPNFSTQITLNESLFALSSTERYSEDNLNFFRIENNKNFNIENSDKNNEPFENIQKKELENNQKYVEIQNSFYFSLCRNVKITQTLKLIQKRVKTPRIYCAEFRRKKINMHYLNVEDIKLFDEALLFGNIKIETNYKDYDSMNPPKSNNTAFCIQKIDKLVKYQKNGYLELILNTTHTDQHHHFRFLIFYFRKIPDNNLQRLSHSLAEYSKLLQNKILPHIIQIRRLLLESPDFSDKAFHIYSSIEEKIIQRMMNYAKNTKFYKLFLLKLNFQTKQLDLALQRISFNLLDLLGIDEKTIDKVYNCSPQSLINFEIIYNGQQRIQNTIFQLQALTQQQDKQQYSTTVLQTIDGIDIQAQVQQEYFYLNDINIEIPSWVHYLDIIGVVIKYDVSPIQVQTVNKLRKGLVQNLNLKDVGIEKNYTSNVSFENGNLRQLENQMLKEIFIEQHYPKLICKINQEFSLIPSVTFQNYQQQPIFKKNRKSKKIKNQN